MCDWQDIVRAYTSRYITNPEDRLPAIVAIAEQFGRGLRYNPGDYLAGLWKQGLPLLLLWFVTNNELRTIDKPSETNAHYPSIRPGFPT